MKKRALISLSDKTGLLDFAKGLIINDYEIISTGNTYNMLRDNGIKALEVANVTGFAECLDGRVKTLHPSIHGGILARRDISGHMDFINSAGIKPIDIVCVNLYPFKQTILNPTATPDDIIENIDIGGPAMIRSAAKNHAAVAVVVDAADYEMLLKEISTQGNITDQTRFMLAAKAFAHTAAYDALIANYLGKLAKLPKYPSTLTLSYEKAQDLRYGENPHQKAAFYKEIPSPQGTLATATKLHGKELSFNNINDAAGALELLQEFDQPTIVAVKHATPCGVGMGDNLYGSWQKAYKADPISIFGGIIAANREIDEETAIQISQIFIEVLIAPSYTQKAIEILTQKKNIRLLSLPMNINQQKTSLDIKKISGGILVQDTNNTLLPKDLPLQYVTEKKPTQEELQDLIFAFKLAKHIKSNGIAIAKDQGSIGLAGGQVCRIWACQQAIDHAMQHFGPAATNGAVLASDAFFPFEDCVQEAAKANITAIIQPGGSNGDQASIDACNKHGIAMVFTGVRHFRH